SVVKWNGKKVTGEHYGTIDLKAGNIVTEGTSITSGAFTMDMSTLVSEDLKDEALNKRLVNHLKSDDFFSVEKHPVSTFILTNVVHNEGNKYSFTGNMTIKGITHPLTFEATVDIHNSSLEAKGKMEIDRTLYDIKFRSGKFFASLGDNLIYDTFTLDFKVIADMTSPAAVSGK
ncbi:MAG: YceI family protein, partial [Prolixibacteraceae bacterium]|nr:YceI family protein [Prolixibacteraceae bacterium]